MKTHGRRAPCAAGQPIRAIEKAKVDIAYANGLLAIHEATWAFIAPRLARKARIPFVYYMIDELHRLVPEAVLRPLAKLIERSNMKASTIVVSINEALREYTIQMGAHPEKTSVIRAGIDFGIYNKGVDSQALRKELGIQKGDVVLFFMGWLYEFSGLKEVALHLAREPIRYGRIKLLMIGKGELWDTIGRIRMNNHLEIKIVLLDWKPYNEVPGYIAASDIGILPTYNNRVMKNIVPIKMYEYMASGKPVIATALPGLRKEFGADNGVTYIDRPEDVPRKALEMLRNATVENEGRKARRFVSGNNWEGVVDEFEITLTSLLSSSESGHYTSR